MNTSFIKLFEPGKIGSLEIKNRIIMAPMGTHWADKDGNVVQKQLDYYAERARGGTGMVVTEACCVQTPVGRGFEQISLDDNKYLAGLTKLAEAIKTNGARACCQLHHAGAASNHKLTRGLTPVGPSAVHRRSFEQSRAFTLDEIKELRDCFIEAAKRCWKVGFDAVELHGAHHYLLAQFLSPAWNERADEYGGSIENRARLMTQIVSGIKAEITEMPVICRINGAEYGTEKFFGTPGLTLEDAISAARLFEAGGADSIHVSAFGWGKYGLKNTPHSEGGLLPLAETIKKAVSVPVIGVGRMLPEPAENTLRENKADFIAIGRGLISEPYFVQKLQTDNVKDIAPCITCNECLGVPRRMICSVNARVGEEGKYPYPPVKAQMPKKVVIIGGGPGGMEAARIAALRGHNVTLYEKEKELGGKLLLADKAPDKENVGLLSLYLREQVEKCGVQVELGTAATPETVFGEGPDAVIIATGSQSAKPDIKGLEQAKVVDALDVIAGKAAAGGKVVIIGGSLVGCEAAGLLSERGVKDISITTRRHGPATDLSIPGMRYQLIVGLRDKGVKFHVGVTYREATERGLTIVAQNGEEQVLEADTLVLVAETKPDDTFQRELEGSVPEIVCIGDAASGKKFMDAIHEGFKIAYSL